MTAPSAECSPESTFKELQALYEDLPALLRANNQGLASCALPLGIMDWNAEDPTLATDPSGNAPACGPPPIRRDFYTGEVFVERQSNFTLRARDLKDVTAIRCIECENFSLDLDGFAIAESAEKRQKFFLHFYGCSSFKIRRICSSGGRNLALLEDCYHFAVSDVECRDYEGYGMIILHSRFFRVENCRFIRNLASGVMILGDSRHGTITDCQFLESQGYYNWDAGLHISHCSRRIAAAQVPELAHEPLPIRNKTMRPSRIRVQRSVFQENRAQGVYLEGARECLFIDNTFKDNNKEGICLDWGTSLCVLRGNEVTGNGNRSNMTETELNIDFVRDFPLLPDRSSSCKLPGISFDNGVLNAIIGNRILDNFGGGIKMVRSAVANVISGNVFSNNDRGANSVVKKMHDVLILTLGNRGGEFDQNRMELLDFYASSFNLFLGNLFAADASEAIHHEREFNRFEGNRFGLSPENLIASEKTNLGGRGRKSDVPLLPRSRPAEASISSNILYAFGSVTDRHHSVLRLRADGVIEFSPHPNESHWRVEGSQLLFFDRDFQVTTRFDFFTEPSGQAVFVGRFKETATLHYLVPLISTDTSPPESSTLPPLFLNALPGCSAPLLEQFFSGLGWVGTRLHCRAVGTMNFASDAASENARWMSVDDRLLSFPKIASIIQPGQALTGNLPWKDEYRQVSSRLCCIHGSRNLRSVLVSQCAQKEARTDSNESSRTAWQHIADPRDRFLAFLDLFAAVHQAYCEFLPWISSDSALIVHSEELLRDGLTPSLMELLDRLGITRKKAQAAFEALAQAEAVPPVHEAPDWSDYWSEHAERRFRSSGLFAMNQKLGYED